jgi:hypothetical protein
MLGTYKKWKDLEIPFHWGENWQETYPNPHRNVYVALQGQNMNPLMVHWSAGFSLKQNSFFNAKITMVEALNYGLDMGWMIGENCSLKDD